MSDVGLLKIGAAAKRLGTTPATMRMWDSSGESQPARRTRKGTRYYAIADLDGFRNEAAPTICYARVSSHDQKAGLERQQASLEAYCAAKWLADADHQRPRQRHELPQKRLAGTAGAHSAAAGETHRAHAQDRLLRLRRGVGVRVMRAAGASRWSSSIKASRPSFEEELAKDVLEIVTVFSARLCGARSHKAKKLMDVASATRKCARARPG